MLVDLRDAAVGDTIRLETLAFDPMHTEGTMSAPVDHAAMEHAMPAGAAAAGARITQRTWPEGAPRTLLELRVRTRVAYDRRRPGACCRQLPPSIPPTPRERPFRLGFAKGRWRINDRVFEMGTHADRGEARHGGNLAHPQLPHEHAARDALARVPLRRAGARNQPRSDRRACGRSAGTPRHRPRAQGHGARLARRVGAHRHRFHASVSRSADRTCSTATISSTRMAG